MTCFLVCAISSDTAVVSDKHEKMKYVTQVLYNLNANQYHLRVSSR